MTPPFQVFHGTHPLLISVPHDGRSMPAEISEKMTSVGREMPDTDWHVTRLYQFAKEIGASILVANYSRYVIDLNRAANDEVLYDGQVSTGLCPTRSFSGAPLYADNQPLEASEIAQRIQSYWQPYHDCLASTLRQIQARFGYALLWDAHSIRSEVPRLFEGTLPALSMGTNDGQSCATNIFESVWSAARMSAYSAVRNARFKGGYITRHYGRPQLEVQAIQLEIAQRVYMDESTGVYDDVKAAQLEDLLGQLIGRFLRSAERHYATESG